MEIQSGPETAGKAFQDKRTLTIQDRYVRNVAEKLLDAEIRKHDFIMVDEFFSKLWKSIARAQKLDNSRSTDDQKEQQRYKKYWSSFNRLKAEKKDFIKQMQIYKMGLVTRKDTNWLGDIPYGTYIITYKSVPACYTKQFWEASLKAREIRNKKRREKRRAKEQKKTT